MFKVIEMVKKGYAKVTLVQTEEPKYHMVVNGIDAELNGPDALNQVYKDLKAKGYTVKVVPENEPKKEAPKAPKPQKNPTWDFEGGFDRQKYLEIAKSNNWTWCDPRGRIHVLKAHREEIYLLMGGKKN